MHMWEGGKEEAPSPNARKTSDSPEIGARGRILRGGKGEVGNWGVEEEEFYFFLTFWPETKIAFPGEDVESRTIVWEKSSRVASCQKNKKTVS